MNFRLPWESSLEVDRLLMIRFTSLWILKNPMLIWHRLRSCVMVSCMTLLSYHVHIYFVTSNRESLHFFSNTATTGRITGFDFVNATTFYEDPHMDMMTQRPNFAGGKWVISTDDDDYDPNTLTFADPAFTAFRGLKISVIWRSRTTPWMGQERFFMERMVLISHQLSRWAQSSIFFCICTSISKPIPMPHFSSHISLGSWDRCW